jgi:hypothetical protein
MEQGFWPYHLIPAARASMLRRLMPLDKLKSGACGIRDHAARPFVPVDAMLQGADCFDPHGPLGAEWRAGDSIWALARSPELVAVQRTLSALDGRGRLATYMAEHGARLHEIGQITALYGIKD